jgi:hypothetical protein
MAEQIPVEALDFFEKPTLANLATFMPEGLLTLPRYG